MFCPSLVPVLASFVPADGVLPVSPSTAHELLKAGVKVAEPFVRPECDLSRGALAFIHLGKDEAICHMLRNGNGFPEQGRPADHLACVQFDLGVTSERRDLRALNVWRASLAQCQADLKRGRCDG